MNILDPERSLNVSGPEGAHILGCSYSTFRRIVARGDIEAVAIPGVRRVMFRRVDIEEYAASLPLADHVAPSV